LPVFASIKSNARADRLSSGEKAHSRELDSSAQIKTNLVRITCKLSFFSFLASLSGLLH
jgi:hypothetical protein